MEHKCISIIIEGSDGAGKATTTALLMDYLKGLGKKFGPALEVQIPCIPNQKEN